MSLPSNVRGEVGARERVRPAACALVQRRQRLSRLLALPRAPAGLVTLRCTKGKLLADPRAPWAERGTRYGLALIPGEYFGLGETMQTSYLLPRSGSGFRSPAKP